jgi:N-succinyldiaminopimelate aminotransferase
MALTAAALTAPPLGAAAAYGEGMSRPSETRPLRPFGTTIFATMSALALRHNGAINLGQGFPDTDGPPQVLDAAVAAIRGGRNQYPPGPGVPELLTAIAAHQRRFYGIELDRRARSS